MQLRDLVKTLSSMSEAELTEKIRQMRHNREVARVGKEAHVKREAKKTGAKESNKLSAMLGKLSPGELAALKEALKK